MAIGIFGGSFNPIHISHLIMARYAIEQMELEKIIFVPLYIQPLKGELPTPPELRYKWVEQSIKRYPKFDISDYEIKLKTKSYTYNTLKHFKQVYPDKKLYFIMGEDSLATLKYWYRYKEIVNFADFIVYPRLCKKDYEVDDFIYSRVRFLQAPLIQISSTHIRDRIKHHYEVDWFLPEEIKDEVIEYYENI
jgi:nicotinate-nucleotide adenylyltransferase